MTKTREPRNPSRHPRRRYLSIIVALVMGFGALVVVLALPAIEHVIRQDVTQERIE